MKKIFLLFLLLPSSLLFGQLAEPEIITPLLHYRFKKADLNGDGFPDLVGKMLNTNQLAWVENDGGTGVFDKRRVISSLEDIDMYILADLEGDGDLDIVATTDDTEEIFYFTNLDGLGNFIGPNPVDIDLSTPCSLSIEVADIDNDGLLDGLFSENCFIGLGWYKNLGNGFGDFLLINEDVDRQIMYPYDYDLDGDIDFVGDDDGVLSYFEHLDGNGAFASPVEIEPDLGNWRSLNIFDINGDDYMDIVYGFNSPNVVAWIKNNGDGTFAEPDE